MTVETTIGPSFHSYNLTTETKLNIDELIYMLNPRDLPLLTGLGSNGMAIMPRMPVDNRKFYWLTEEVPLPRGTLLTTVNNSITTIVCTAGQGVRFAVGDILLIDSEHMAITANDGADNLTVIRASSGSSAASHTAGAEMLDLGSVLTEGNIGVGNFRGRDELYNVTQIFSKKISVTRTEQKLPKYGVPNELNKQILNNMQGINTSIEQAALYGLRYDDSTTQKRQTGGLLNAISTNADTSTVWITVADIETRQQTAYDNGGMFDVLLSRPKNFTALNNVADSSRVRTVIDDPRRGRMQATTIITQFGEVDLVNDRWCRLTDAFGYSRDNMTMRVFDPLMLQKLAKVDDTDPYMILTEVGFEQKGEQHMCKFTGLDATQALPTDLI